MGNVAAVYAENSKFQISNSRQLSVTEVYEMLTEIAHEEGEGSLERKVEKTAKLLSDLDPLSAKYVARILVGKLRLGFSDMTILDALSVMLMGDQRYPVK